MGEEMGTCIRWWSVRVKESKKKAVLSVNLNSSGGEIAFSKRKGRA